MDISDTQAFCLLPAVLRRRRLSKAAYYHTMHLQPTEACSLTDAGGAFEGLLPDALLLDSSANEMAAMIMQELESSINSTEGEEHHAAANGWASLLPAASGTLSPSAAAGCYTAPIDHTCAGAGPIWTASPYAVQQQHDLAVTAPAAAGASSDLAGHSAASGCTAAAAAAPSSSLLHFSQHPTAAGLAGMAGCSPVPLLLPCEGQYPQFAALMQRRDSCAGGSSTLHCASPSSTPAFSAGGPHFLCTSDDSSMPCGDAAAAAAIAAAAPAAGAPAVVANKRRGASAQVRR